MARDAKLLLIGLACGLLLAPVLYALSAGPVDVARRHELLPAAVADWLLYAGPFPQSHLCFWAGADPGSTGVVQPDGSILWLPGRGPGPLRRAYRAWLELWGVQVLGAPC